MKAQCPDCKQLWNIEADEQDQSMKCFYCKSQFKATPYSGPVAEESPSEPPESQQPLEKIGNPGLIWYILGGAIGLFGFFAGLRAGRQPFYGRNYG